MYQVIIVNKMLAFVVNNLELNTNYVHSRVYVGVYTHEGLVLMRVGLLRGPSPFEVNAATVTEYSVLGHRSDKISS